MLIFKILIYIIIYAIKQRLLNEKINIKTVIYVLILSLYTKPVLEMAISRNDLLQDLNTYIDWIIMLVILI